VVPNDVVLRGLVAVAPTSIYSKCIRLTVRKSFALAMPAVETPNKGGREKALALSILQTIEKKLDKKKGHARVRKGGR